MATTPPLRNPGGIAGRATKWVKSLVSPTTEDPDESRDRVDQDRRHERQGDLERAEGKSVSCLEQTDPSDEVVRAGRAGLLGR
jgi:hypothetical protein